MTESLVSSGRSSMRAIAGWLSVLAGVIMAANAVLSFVWALAPAPTFWPSSLYAACSVVSFTTAAITHPASRRRLADREWIRE